MTSSLIFSEINDLRLYNYLIIFNSILITLGLSTED